MAIRGEKVEFVGDISAITSIKRICAEVSCAMSHLYHDTIRLIASSAFDKTSRGTLKQ